MPVRRYDIPTPRLRDALRPSGSPWAFTTGVRAILAAAIIALAGVMFGEPASIGVAYCAATMSTLFAVGGTHRARLTAMAMQAIGAVMGIAIGAATPHTVLVAVVVAASMAMIAGMVAAIDPAFSAFALLLVVGTAYGQFGGSPLPVGLQCLWYLIGSVIVAAIVASESIATQPRHERAAISSLLMSNAALLDAIGDPIAASSARRNLADSASDCRSRLYEYRLTIRRGSESVDVIERAAQTARRVTLVVATLYAKGQPVPAAAGQLLRDAGCKVAAGESIDVPTVGADADSAIRLVAHALAAPPVHPSSDDTELVAAPSLSLILRSIVRAATRRPAIGAGVRLALCVAAATGLAAVMHGEHHAFWLPLTVAVVVRPELQSVFVRVLNRIVGSIVGAVLAAAVLLAAPDNWALALGAAVAMGLSAVAAPKVYGLFVIGITTSTLLSASIGEINPLAPELRLGDTLIGCAIAIIFGYVLWPRRLFVADSPVHASARSVAAYLRAAADPDTSATTLRDARRRAYDRTNALRRTLQSSALDPVVLSPTARAELPMVLALEDVADDITDLAHHVTESRIAPPRELLDSVEQEILAVGTHRVSVSSLNPYPDGPLPRIRATLSALP
ncbi:FUSC family protein [Smaragdicoccus niigatensis]|uniref:FUSC family protein n=1 Tax=Smaragdicoccus niigatensis TaxID=359359 RepID=UPI00039E55B3|nr:FUSC family protein [Smaragdicoccus niigatensis]